MHRFLVSIAVIMAVVAMSAAGPSAIGPSQANGITTIRAAGVEPLFLSTAFFQEDEKAATEGSGEKAKDKELTLERLFPEKSFFGPSARSMQFSSDGRYAAYLYRPYIERRHGTDLWLYDSETGETKRLTMVSVMSEFQESTRKVKEDRIEKARKRAGNGEGKDESKAGEEESAVPTDPLSGDWEGTLTGREGSGLPPEGVTIHLALMLHEDGLVTGMVKTSWNKAVITHGIFIEQTGVMECEMSVLDSELHATMRVEVGNDDTMTGRIKLEGVNLDLEVTARRTAKLEGHSTSGNDEGTGNGEGDTDKAVERSDDGKDDGKDTDIKVEDTVDEKDADDERAPRYHGVSTYTWAPESNEMIFTSDSDLYRMNVEDGSIERLTRTRARERDVQYLPDGTGYTYMNEDALIRVQFGSSLLEQIDPDLPGGESMTGYSISPDGKRLAFLADKGESYWGRGQLVNIVSYRSRFAQVNQVTRHMSDDPYPDYFTYVYLYDLAGHMTEEGNLKKVYEHKQSGPRDIMRVPEWSPDSSRVAWSVFNQASGQVDILESQFTVKDTSDTKSADGKQAEGDGSEDDGRLKIGNTAPVEDRKPAEKKPEIEISDAKVIYRLLHNGGPNTPGMIEPQYLPDSRRLVFITELSGFRHLHVLDPTYEQLDQLTKGRFEVYPFDMTEDHTAIYATATKEDPTQIDIYRIDVETGEMERLSTMDGSYSSAAVNDQGTCCLANFTDFGKPTELVVIDIATHEQVDLTDSHPEEAHVLTEPVPEYFTYRNRHGQEIHGHMFKPDGWTKDDQRPLLIYVYGGPLGTSKMATRGSFSGSSYFFPYYMTKKHGYVTCTIDPRGASGYGGLFEKSNYEQVGKPQVEDLVDGAKWFAENMGVDAKRIGLHGWSFGGFQTQMCLYTEPDVFACGMAGAGPTEWENYNSWYSTGTIGPSRTGHADLAQFSLLPLAKNLKAKLLLMHGMEDSNVLYQDTVRVYRELLKAGKETLVELFLDPTGGHGMGGDVKTLNRYRKYEEFLLRTIGEVETVKESTESEGTEVTQPDSAEGDTEWREEEE